MDYERLFQVADAARGRKKLSAGDETFVRTTIPDEMAAYPRFQRPKSIQHPSGFTVTGAPVGTFIRSAILLAGRKALGDRYGGDPFYERVEAGLALSITGAYFNGMAPKGAFCCKQCTLAVLPVLEANALRWIDCKPLAQGVREMIHAREWRFNTLPNAKMMQWALSGPAH